MQYKKLTEYLLNFVMVFLFWVFCCFFFFSCEALRTEKQD